MGVETEYGIRIPLGLRGRALFALASEQGDICRTVAPSARPASVTAGDLGTGARIGRYVIIERVGIGAMGVVYGAYDPELDRKVALKLIKPGQSGAKDTARARLLREAKAIARLQHPNVVAVHDVGVFEDQVFLAMEFVAGGTIKSWLAEKTRSWREILDVFIAAGRGLAAAHAAGLVHRDFKPDNVLLDKEGRPRVVDFGIARQAGGGDELDGETGDVAEDAAATLQDTSGRHALATLTKTGTWVGTPAYMAPEQFLGERGDEKSDQFSFCVALYEALYGERPFAGDDMLSISVNVTTEQLRPLPKDRGVPNWVRRVILRGLKVEGAGRWDSMAALIRALENDPAVNLRRRLVTGGSAVLVVTALVVAWQIASRRRAEAEREIARYVGEATRAASTAQAKATEARDLRSRAFAAFDAMNKDEGEVLWRQTRALLSAIDIAYDQAERNLETAFMLDQSRREQRDASGRRPLRAPHVRRAIFVWAARWMCCGSGWPPSMRRAAGRRHSMRRGRCSWRTAPAASQAILERYEREPSTGRRIARPVGPIGAHSTTSLTPGSYRLLLDGPGLAHVVYPFEVEAGEKVAVDLALPRASAVPDGFSLRGAWPVLVRGRGRTAPLAIPERVPIHRRRTGAYVIAQHETTYAEWIAFLNALPGTERARNLPDVSAARARLAAAAGDGRAAGN